MSKIVDIQTYMIKSPVKKPFKTSLRTVLEVDDVVVKITTDDGFVGYGEAAETAVITGDIKGSIIDAIERYIKPTIIGMDVFDFDNLMLKLDKCILHNSSAKAACDIAIYDIIGQYYKMPLYKFLGGYRKDIKTDITISLNDVDTMVNDTLYAIKEGFDTFKIKVGGDYKKDIERVKAIRDAAGSDAMIRLDANQGWNPKEAIFVINKLADYDIELVEQPVIAYDIDGLKMVTDNVPIPVMADECLFSPQDALKILSMKAADILNIKLMKSGGIHNALKINAMAESAGIVCMIGSMMECKISVTAAAHLAAACHNITKYDLDAAYLLKEDPVIGGAIYNGPNISFSDGTGLCIKGIEENN